MSHEYAVKNDSASLFKKSPAAKQPLMEGHVLLFVTDLIYCGARTFVLKCVGTGQQANRGWPVRSAPPCPRTGVAGHQTARTLVHRVIGSHPSSVRLRSIYRSPTAFIFYF